uniref:Uncharacterized protein n=1 Tax=Mesocestoides corti TaxID=53468 RepID=A0A5K3ELE5_MESCO
MSYHIDPTAHRERHFATAGTTPNNIFVIEDEGIVTESAHEEATGVSDPDDIALIPTMSNNNALDESIAETSNAQTQSFAEIMDQEDEVASVSEGSFNLSNDLELPVRDPQTLKRQTRGKRVTDKIGGIIGLRFCNTAEVDTSAGEISRELREGNRPTVHPRKPRTIAKKVSQTVHLLAPYMARGHMYENLRVMASGRKRCRRASRITKESRHRAGRPSAGTAASPTRQAILSTDVRYYLRPLLWPIVNYWDTMKKVGASLFTKGQLALRKFSIYRTGSEVATTVRNPADPGRTSTARWFTQSVGGRAIIRPQKDRLESSSLSHNRSHHQDENSTERLP